MEETQIMTIDKAQIDDREAVLSTIQSYESAASLRALVFFARSSGPLQGLDLRQGSMSS